MSSGKVNCAICGAPLAVDERVRITVQRPYVEQIGKMRLVKRDSRSIQVCAACTDDRMRGTRLGGEAWAN